LVLATGKAAPSTAVEEAALVDDLALRDTEELVEGERAMPSPRRPLTRLFGRRGTTRVVRAAQAEAGVEDVAVASMVRLDDDAARQALSAPSEPLPVAAITSPVAGDEVVDSTGASVGLGIISLGEAESEAERPAADAQWSQDVTLREQRLAADLAAREAAEEEARLEDARREQEAAVAQRQRELEEVALAEEARVRAQARARRWFVRLDADLDAPTIAERMAMAGTLAIRAAWAGKLLREAFAQEDEPKVRARIIGALVGGNHLDVPEPFQLAFERGGIERAAVWETLAPRRGDAQWIEVLLAPLLETMTAA
jgi:hypothetical protein